MGKGQWCNASKRTLGNNPNHLNIIKPMKENRSYSHSHAFLESLQKEGRATCGQTRAVVEVGHFCHAPHLPRHCVNVVCSFTLYPPLAPEGDHVTRPLLTSLESLDKRYTVCFSSTCLRTQFLGTTISHLEKCSLNNILSLLLPPVLNSNG